MVEAPLPGVYCIGRYYMYSKYVERTRNSCRDCGDDERCSTYLNLIMRIGDEGKTWSRHQAQMIYFMMCKKVKLGLLVAKGVSTLLVR